MDGLLVDGRGGYSAGFEDAVDGFPRDGSRGEGAAGVSFWENGGEVHGVLVLSSNRFTFVMYWGCPLRKGKTNLEHSS